MPTFLTGDSTSACTTVCNYIPAQNQTAATSRAHRAKLLTQTQVLTDALNELGKLENDGGIYGVNSACNRIIAL